MKRLLYVVSLALVFSLPVAAQSVIDFDRGFVPFFSYDSSAFDNVNLSTGTLVLHIPILSYPQRGTVPDVSLFASYNNTVWLAELYFDYSDSYYQWTPDGGDLNITSSFNMGYDCPAMCYLTDADGGSHLVGMTGTYTEETIDGTAFLGASGVGTVDPNGVTYNGGFYPTDPYGNSVTGGTSYYTDTIGRTIPRFADYFTWGGGSPACLTDYFPGPPGSTSVPVEECYSNFSIATSFETTYAGYPAYNWTSTATLLQSITLPNSTSWVFNYDTYGRLTSITTPTGGTISYTWNFNMSGWPYDSTVATRTMYDGTTSNVWSYSYTPGVSSLMSATNVADPDGHYTYHHCCPNYP